MRFGIGQSVPRSEDPRFVAGRGRYVADIDLPHQTHAVFLYSPHAHAAIKSIDVAAAQSVPGVLAVLTGKEWAADGLGATVPEMMPEDMGGPKGYRSKHPPLALERVRYVGERVAVVIARSEAAARDAADKVEVVYQPLAAVVSTADAVKPGAPQIYEGAANNICFPLQMGNAADVDAAFARAAHVARLE